MVRNLSTMERRKSDTEEEALSATAFTFFAIHFYTQEVQFELCIVVLCFM
jgi:hypothetical protein